jgi:2-dehydro-3-deoxyphosphogluconate aldolase/(4S)-4-hydroxy-2-oxoglutarate aldolase
VSAIDALARQCVLPVLRCANADDTLATARAAAAAGCRIVEVTMSTPGVEAAIAPLVADGLLVAVGTVRNAADVPRLADAGASLVVSFWRPPGFVAAAGAAGIPAIPGAFTPQELAEAPAKAPQP